MLTHLVWGQLTPNKLVGSSCMPALTPKTLPIIGSCVGYIRDEAGRGASNSMWPRLMTKPTRGRAQDMTSFRVHVQT